MGDVRTAYRHRDEYSTVGLNKLLKRVVVLPFPLSVVEQYILLLKLHLPFVLARILQDKSREGGTSVIISGKWLYRVVEWGNARHFL